MASVFLQKISSVIHLQVKIIRIKNADLNGTGDK